MYQTFRAMQEIELTRPMKIGIISVSLAFYLYLALSTRKEKKADAKYIQQLYEESLKQRIAERAQEKAALSADIQPT